MELLGIFFNVLAPVFLLVLIGYVVGPRLELQARTLSRFSLNILTPAFIFHVLSTARIDAALAVQMALYILAVHIGNGVLGLGLARLLQRPRPLMMVFFLVAMFGNVGNLGLPIITFAVSDGALDIATVYFATVTVMALIFGIGAARWQQAGLLPAVITVLRTPVIIALPISIICNWLQIRLPPLLDRPITMLADALIPTVLVMLGVQMAQSRMLRPDRDMLAVSGMRLIGSPLLAVLLAMPFGISGIERDVAIIQSGMPAAVLIAVIANEYDLMPDFVTATILFSTLASVVTLTFIISFL